MIRFFKTLQPATLILIPLIVLMFWARILFHSMPVSDNNSGVLWYFIVSVLNVFPSWVNFFLLVSIISWQAIYLNLILNRYEVLYKNTFVPALIYAIFISCTPLIMYFHPIHIINLLMILIINESFALYKNEFPVSKLFNAGFLSGIAALMYFPAIILLPLIITMIAILRPFRFKEYLIAIVGFFLPFFFVSTYMFWNHNLPAFFSQQLEHYRHIRISFLFHQSRALLLLAIYISLIIVLSLLKVRINFRKNVIRTRSYQQIILILMIYATGWVMLSASVTEIQFVMLLIPAAIFCAYYFMSGKRRPWLYEYALWILVGLVIWNHLVT